MYDMDTLVADMGDYYLGELLCRCLCKINPDALGYRNRLAIAVQEQGRYKEVEERLCQCLEAIKSEFGEAHPNTLAYIHNLAMAVQEQGRYGEAEELHCQCLESTKSALGEAHPSILLCMNNLAGGVQQQG
eukprot:1299294-Ditylum_brightwellii.AAC.1